MSMSLSLSVGNGKMNRSDPESSDMNTLLGLYNLRKDEIQNRIREFKGRMEDSEERIFAELCFCICTPQSKATACWEAVSTLVENGLLYRGSEAEITPFLNDIRFGDRKAIYIVGARRFFTKDDRLKIKERLKAFSDNFELREWLVRNVKGLGMKEASHFLRNVGLGMDLAILDRHVLRNLRRLHVIREIPKHLTRRDYETIERKMRSFAEKTGIPMADLDLLLWSLETGIVFK